MDRLPLCGTGTVFVVCVSACLAPTRAHLVRGRVTWPGGRFVMAAARRGGRGSA